MNQPQVSLLFIMGKTWGLIFLLAGFVVAEEPTKDWRISTTLGNSVGIGTFVTGYAQQPAWSSSLILDPSYQFQSFWGLPRITLSALETFGFWWLDSYGTSASDLQNRFSLSDLNLSASMGKILEAESAGVSLDVSTGILLPLSQLSRNISRIMAFTLSAPLRWSKWGFNAGWTPAFSGWLYSDSVISAPCSELPSAVLNPQTINADMGQFLQGLALTRNSDEKLNGGRCMIAGRQTIFSLSNMFSAGWSNPNHTVSLGLGWFLNFLRPLSQSSGQNFTEATMGRVAYTYKIPIETDLSLSAGILSAQALYTRSGELAFPLFDFVTPGNNQSQIFLQATVGI